MSAKDDLKKVIEILSEYECKHLLGATQNIIGGERFWEGDISIFYNEYAKVRYFDSGTDSSNITPSNLVTEDQIFAPITIAKSYPDALRVKLLPPEPINIPLTEVLINRRSKRDYSGGAISLYQLSSLLQNACGITGFITAYGYTRLPLRSFPSSGGLQSPELYLSIQAVDGVCPGIYHYNPQDQVLESIRLGDYRQTLQDLALGQVFVETSAIVFIITGYYESLRWKYGERAYRYMCMDVGFLGENLYLVAETLRLGTCAIAGFVDDAISEILCIDGQDEIPLLLITVGV